MNYLVKSKLPTKYGTFLLRAYQYKVDDFPNLALCTKDLDTKFPVYVRIHSECMTGDVFGSAKCDCGEQLDYSMRWIQKHGGVIIYLRQEGRGIGLVNNSSYRARTHRNGAKITQLGIFKNKKVQHGTSFFN